MQENQHDNRQLQIKQSVEKMKQKRKSLPQKRKIQSLIDRGCLIAKEIMKDITSNIYQSFVNLRSNKNTTQSAYANRKPSKMTIQLIKQIHCGFEPLELSAKRWFSQEEEQIMIQKQDIDQMLINQDLINNCQIKTLKKKMVKIYDEKLEDPRQYDINIWEIGEGNITLSKRRLEIMEKEQIQREQKIMAEKINLKQVKSNLINKMQQNNQAQKGIQVIDQKITIEQMQATLPVILQSKLSHKQSQNKQKNIASVKAELGINHKIDHKQEQTNKDKALNEANKIVNPFLTTSSSKRLSIVDLGGMKSDIFGNHNIKSILNSNLASTNQNNQSPFVPKNEEFQWSNNANQNHSNKIELKPELFNNIEKTGPFTNQNISGPQYPPFPMQQGNPFSNNNALNNAKKGLETGQMATSSIFKSTQSFQKMNYKESARQFSQTFNIGNVSNQKVKAMFSKQQNTAVEAQSLFDLPSHNQQNTEKKNKNNRRYKKDKYDRIN